MGAAAPDLVPDLPLRIHLLGAGGAGISGAARLLLARGHALSGHDREPSAFTPGLSELGVALQVGRSRADGLPPDAEAVVRSAAIPAEDPQVLRALERGLPVLKYGELVPLLAPPGTTLAVAGTHGKTTTAWLLYHALRGVAKACSAPGDFAPAPGALVGGEHRELRTNAVAPGPPSASGSPPGWFAVEACEYDRSFLRLQPRGAAITNVEPDHLDYYGSYEALEAAFARFADRVHPQGLVVVGSGVPDVVEENARAPVWRLGRELRVDLLAEERGRFAFRLRAPGWATPPLALRVPGAFNVDNAALGLALAVGVAAREAGAVASEAAALGAVEVGGFPGVARRFEPWGSVGSIELVHDYAHHPTEVAATLEAARRAFPGLPLHVLFQPHQYSRTARFLAEFVESLRGADRVVVADVYGARAAIDDRSADAGAIVARLRRAGVEAAVGGRAPEAARLFADALPREAAALILGAGDVDRVRDDLLAAVAVRGALPR